MDVKGEIKEQEQIIEIWPGFGPEEDDEGNLQPNKLIGHPRVHFTEHAVVLDLRSQVMLLDGTETRQLFLVEPSTGDLTAMDSVKGQIAKTMILLGAIAGMKQSEVAKLKGQDFLLAQEIIGGFLSDGRPTPGT